MKAFFGLYPIGLATLILILFQEKTLEQSIEDGAEIYQDFCVQCHLPNGEGVPDVFPPLNKSDYLLKNPEKSIAALKFGLQGPITVNGIQYNGNMADQGLYDDEIADVMNYILHAWDNKTDVFIKTKDVESITIMK